MTRRNFIGGMSAFGCIGFGSAFSAPSDFALRAKGNLRFGVVSDPHVSLSLPALKPDVINPVIELRSQGK